MENFHLAAYLQSVDPAGAFVQLAAINDTQLTVNTPVIRVPTLTEVLALAGGVDITVAATLRLVSPSLRVKSLFAIEPLNTATAAAVVPTTPHKVYDLRRTPISLVYNEALTMELLSNPAAVQVQWGLVWFGAGPIVPIADASKIFTVRGTATTTLTANVWTNGVITLDQDLPRGRYSMVGMRARSAGLVAARCAFVGGKWRPGCIGSIAQADLEHTMFRHGGLGSWGEFEDIETPTIDFLSTSADTAETVYLDLIQVREGPGSGP